MTKSCGTGVTNSRAVVVIGHVDHGKTALVGALTGIQTDTAPQERARGLSIRPGFAPLETPAGTLDLIDAPGHEDFIEAMVCGAAGAQAVLLVVAADAGVASQTREHLRIAQLLGLTQAVVAVSKCDLVPTADLPQQLARIRAALAGTPFAAAPLLPCSAQSGAGLPALKAALGALIGAPAPRPQPRHAALPIDRAFTLSGRGTIVTGTLLGAPLEASASLRLQPGGQVVTLRGLQMRGVDVPETPAGARVAANLRGVDLGGVARGMVLTDPAAGPATRCIDVQLETGPVAVKHMQKLRLMIGTASVVATLRLYRRDGFGQLRLARPVWAFEGQRAVLRRLSPAATLGGVRVLDPQALPARAGDGARIALLEAVASGQAAAVAQALSDAQGGAAQGAQIGRLLRCDTVDVPPGFIEIGGGFLAPSARAASCRAQIHTALAAHHARHPLRSTAPVQALGADGFHLQLWQHCLSEMRAAAQITQTGAGIALAGHAPQTHPPPECLPAIRALDGAARAAGLGPVPIAGDDSEVAAYLCAAGHLVVLENIALRQSLTLHHSALAQAAQTLQGAFADVPFTTSQARSALATTRRVIVPLLEHFDAAGITIRMGDTRRLTGRLPVPPPPLPC